MNENSPLKYIIGICIIVVAFVVWQTNKATSFEDADDFFPVETDIGLAPPLSEPPYQDSYSGDPFQFKGVVAMPSHEFIITARVLSRHDYNDAAGFISKTDLAVVWGRLAEDEHSAKLKPAQRGRKSKLVGYNDVALPKETVLQQFANIHLVPSTDELAEKIATIAINDMVIIAGKLVSFDEQRLVWKTSTVRDDLLCEIIFVENLQIIKPD